MTQVDYQFKKTEFSDLPQILSIAREVKHSNWTESDYRDEIGKSDVFAVSATIEQKIIGFLVARLIITDNSLLDCMKCFNSVTPEVKNKEVDESGIFDAGIFVAGAKDSLNSKCICHYPVEIDIEIYNIAVSASFQKQGIGAALLNKLYGDTKRSFEFRRINVWLEVRNSNRRALDFYLKQGFERISERKNYYTCPNENAWVLKREIARDDIR